MKIFISLLLLVLFTLPAWSATPITAGTDLSTVLNSSGEYELQAGTHTVNATFTMATNVTLTAAEDASLVIASGQILNFDDGNVIEGVYIRMESNSRLQAAAASGNTTVQNARIEGNTFVRSGTITTAPYLRFGQGFGAGQFHQNNVVRDNDFYEVSILEEVGNNIAYEGNHFYNMAGLRPLQIWGSNHRVIGNYVDGGIFGLSLLGKHNIAAARRPCTGNVFAGNIVLNTSEEGISMDVVGNVAAETVIREYDTVATTPGSSVITLSSANWSAQTTYTGSVYDLVFVTGTLAGKRYKITTHSGASFTLANVSSDYASITVGDGVSIQLSCYGNTIANNIVIPALIEGRDFSSGIVLHGTGTENTIANNIVYGVDTGAGSFDNYAIREANLNGIVATDAITYDGTNSTTIAATQRRAPVGLNTITNNRSIGGGTGVDYINYSSSADYTPIGSTYTDMQEVTRESLKWIGGPNPATAEGFQPKPNSPLIGAGSPLGAKYDYNSFRFGNPPNIGAFGSTYQDTRSSYSIRTDY